MNKKTFKLQGINIIRSLINQIFGTQNIRNIIVLIAKISGVDLLTLAYNKMGILKYENDQVSGEDFVINYILPKVVLKSNAVLFDVGANIGNYSKKLRSKFDNVYIYSFEPNPYAYDKLQINLSSLSIHYYKLGLSSQNNTRMIYSYASENDSQHSSLYKKVFTDIHQSNDIIEAEFKTISIDEFCKNNHIDYINFIKIDTEGHEYEILKGAKKMINDGKIGIIQFEFNEMNIISRVFLKDFYDLLNEYFIYRLDSKKLIPLLSYSSINEIFKYQNLLAIHQNLNVEI